MHTKLLHILLLLSGHLKAHFAYESHIENTSGALYSGLVLYNNYLLIIISLLTVYQSFNSGYGLCLYGLNKVSD